MARGSLKSLVQHLRAVVAAAGVKDLTDCELLERFARSRDETAFAALVERHGPLVLGVCRRVLHHHHDAEDAFQATFLVLARKAKAVRWRESIRSWLYQVASRISLEVRSRNLRRQGREQVLVAEPASPEMSWQEAGAVLEEEIARLPEKFRAPLLICYLDGKTRDEAAELLGWPASTVKGRLERGREMLRKRLTRRGLTLSAGLVATLLSQKAAAAVPPVLMISTVKAGAALGQAGASSASALALADAAVHAMAMAKVKIAAALAMTFGLLAGGVGVVGRGMLERPNPGPAVVAQADVPLTVASDPLAPPPQVEPLAEPPPPELLPRPVPAEEEQPPNPAKDRERLPRPAFSSELVRINREERTLTIGRVEDGGPRERTFSLARNVEVQVDGTRRGRLEELGPGLRVGLYLGEDRQTVTRITADGPTQRRQIVGVNEDRRELIVQGEGRTQQLPLADEVVVTVEGEPARLKDVPPGPAEIKLSVDQRTVVGIRAGLVRQPDTAPRDGDRPRR